MRHPGYIEDDDYAEKQEGRDVFQIATPSSNPRRPSKPDALAELIQPFSPRTYVVVWILLLVLHGLCSAYLLAMAMLYYFMENPLMAYYANLLALPEHRYFRTFGTLVGMLGALHGLQLLLHILWSIRARAPAVWSRAAMVDRVVKVLHGLTQAKASKPLKPPVRSSRSRSSFSTISSGLQEVLSVEGSHFTLVFMIRKAVEAGAQIVQCHRYSTLIPRVWINHAYASMVVANCWATPMLDSRMLALDSRATSQVASLRLITRMNLAKSIRERAICVSVDTLLTTVTCIILPLAIFRPYALAFDPGWYGFPMEMLYGDSSFPNLIRENEALFALNILDGVTKLVPHVSILFGMASISLLLELYPPLRFARKTTATVPTSIVVRRQTAKALNIPASLTPPKDVGQSFSRRVVTPIAFVVTGAIVLGLHLRAAHLANSADIEMSSMCTDKVRPWFAVNVSCSVVVYNCYRQDVLTPPMDSLDRLQNDAVTAVIFEHCAAFEMPPSIRHFPNLLGLELWNVTLTKWGADAALNDAFHPKMIYFVMAYTNMTEMPQGLLTPPLPALLADIEMAVTNLTKIPDELADAWANVRLVYLEHTPLEEFPTAFFRIPSLSVSLLNDGLESIPEDLFTSVVTLDEYLEFSFSYNPVKSLPIAIRDDLLINYLSLDHTELAELPTWIDKVGQWITLGGTPMCNESQTELSAIQDCSNARWDPISDGRYPLSLVAPFREL